MPGEIIFLTNRQPCLCEGALVVCPKQSSAIVEIASPPKNKSGVSQRHHGKFMIYRIKFVMQIGILLILLPLDAFVFRSGDGDHE